MNKFQKIVAITLGLICIDGGFGIPIGDPKFIVEAVVLESTFIALCIISIKNFKFSYIPSFVIAGIVIAGNTLSPKHIEIMFTLHPLYNAIVLITGGYVLQGILLISNLFALKEYRVTLINKNSG